MNCPFCGSQMVKGVCQMHGGHTLNVARALTGVSWEDLVFKANPSQRTVSVLRPSDERPGLCCPACGAMVIEGPAGGRFSEGEGLDDGRNSEVIACLQCGRAMAADQSRCVTCGWTFED